MSQLTMDTHSGDDSHFNRDEQFERLPSAPIVEAVIHWQAPAGQQLDKDALRTELTRRFTNYDCRNQQEIGANIQASAEGVELRQKTQWDGYRLIGKGEADRYIVQIKPNGVVVSRLAPYDCWEAFSADALPFWNTYVELADPPVIQRLGVRYINEIKLDDNRQARYYLKKLLTPPKGMALSGELFLYQDNFKVLETPYRINWVRTVQPKSEAERSLLVDIDVSTEQIVSLDQNHIVGHLAKMRKLKNRLFFACMTRRAIQQFRRDDDE